MELSFPTMHSFVSEKIRFLRPIFYPIIIGLAIRLALSVYSAHAGDQFAYAAIGLGQVFGSGPYANPNLYPPGWDLILGGLGRVVSYVVPPSNILFPTALNYAMQNAIGGWEPFYMASPVFVFSEKLLFIFFDLATGLLLFQLALEAKIPQLNPRFIFLVWFFNPLVIWESSVHGDFDVLPAFFALLALLFVLRGRPLWTGVSLGLSIILKLFALFLIPLALVLLLRKRGNSESPRAPIVTFLGLFIVGLAIPLLGVFWTPGLLQQYYVYAFTGASVGEGYGGFWIWSFTSFSGFHPVGGWLTTHSAIVTDVSLAFGGCVAAALASVPYWSRRFRDPKLLASSALFLCGICASYFADAVVQPQYIIWMLPFMALWAGTKRSLLALLLAISALAVAFDNLAVGPLYYWQALTYYFGTPSQSLLVSSSNFFYHHELISYPLTFIPGFVAVVAFLILTLRETRVTERSEHAA